MVVLPYVSIPDLHIGPVPIHPFGVLVATGVLIGWWLAVRRAERYGVPKNEMESFISWGLAFGFVLSHLIDEVLYRPHDIIEHPIQLLKVWSGISSFGGFIGGTVGAFVWKLRHKRPILPLLEHVLTIFPIGWIFGRAGCSVAHDHIGRASTSFFAVNFPGGPRFDLGLLEMLLTIPIAIATMWFARKPRPPGAIIGFVSVIYAPIRFPLDALRATDIINADARYLGFTPGQWLSIALFILGVTLLVRARKLPPTMPVPLPPKTDGAPQSGAPSIS